MQKESVIYYNVLHEIQGDTCLYKGIVYEGHQRHEIIYDHRDFDGLSAMIKTLKTYNLFYPKMYSGLNGRKKPSFFLILKSFLSFRSQFPYQPKTFKNFKKELDLTRHPTLSSDLMLTREETHTIEKKCKAHQVSLNAYLLFHLKELLKEYTQSNGGKTIFMLPVNLRENVDEMTDFGNEVSFIDIIMDDQDSLNDINHQIHKKFKEQLQWGTFFATKLIGFFPSFLHKFLIKDYIKNTHRTGLFSSMGVWDKKGILPPTKVGAIPVNFSHMPFSISVIHWQNAISFGISINPKTQITQEETHNILLIYKNRLLNKDLI